MKARLKIITLAVSIASLSVIPNIFACSTTTDTHCTKGVVDIMNLTKAKVPDTLEFNGGGTSLNSTVTIKADGKDVCEVKIHVNNFTKIAGLKKIAACITPDPDKTRAEQCPSMKGFLVNPCEFTDSEKSNCVGVKSLIPSQYECDIGLTQYDHRLSGVNNTDVFNATVGVYVDTVKFGGILPEKTLPPFKVKTSSQCQ